MKYLPLKGRGVLQLGRISRDGSKVHADASQSKAVSYQRLQEIETRLQAEVEELFALGERAEQEKLPDGLIIADEIARRQTRLAQLAQAKAVIEARAKERFAAEQAEYAAKVREREEQGRKGGASREAGRPRPRRRDRARRIRTTSPIPTRGS